MMTNITTARAVRGDMVLPRAVGRNLLGEQAAARAKGEQIAQQMSSAWHQWRRRTAALN